MIACTLNGITFTNFNEVDINESDEVICKINEKFSDDEVALEIQTACNFTLGYIPKLSTIEKWGNDAKEAGDLDKADYLRERWKWTQIVRDFVTTDILRNKMTVNGKINRIMRHEDDSIKSISISFDYM